MEYFRIKKIYLGVLMLTISIESSHSTENMDKKIVEKNPNVNYFSEWLKEILKVPSLGGQ